MNKREFLEQLKKELSGLPQSDLEDRLTFYGEMIDDRTEEGMTESEAVSGVGTVKEVAAQILSDIPLGKLVKEKVKPNRTLKAWEIVLLILGSPVCLSLLISACAVIIARVQYADIFCTQGVDHIICGNPCYKGIRQPKPEQIRILQFINSDRAAAL